MSQKKCVVCGADKPKARHGNSNVCSDDCRAARRAQWLLQTTQSRAEKRIVYLLKNVENEKRRRTRYEKQNRKRINARIVERRIKANAALAVIMELGLLTGGNP